MSRLFLVPAAGLLALACAAEPQSSTAGARERSGAEIFATHCAICHGKTGAGDTAMARGYRNANLADGNFAHGGSHEEIVDTITNGVPRSPMLPLRARLSPEEIDAVALYVRQLVR